jgi:ribonucleoside-diphosphate reductase beta chain
MNFAFEVIHKAQEEEPDLLDNNLKLQVLKMLDEAIACEMVFADDILNLGVIGLSKTSMKQYLEFVADQRLVNLGLDPVYKTKNPYQFMELQDVQELTNFFERRVAAYQTGIEGNVNFNEEF